MKNLCDCITEAFASITVYNRKLSLFPDLSLVIVSLFFSNSVLSLSLLTFSTLSLPLYFRAVSLSLLLSALSLSLGPWQFPKTTRRTNRSGFSEVCQLQFSLRAIRRRDSVECCIIRPCLVLFGCSIKIKIMSGNINGSQLDCSTRGDRLGLLSLQFCVLIYHLSLQRLPCGNIRQNDAGFVYSTA